LPPAASEPTASLGTCLRKRALCTRLKRNRERKKERKDGGKQEEKMAEKRESEEMNDQGEKYEQRRRERERLHLSLQNTSLMKFTISGP
jgi:hypothetical protein